MEQALLHPLAPAMVQALLHPLGPGNGAGVIAPTGPRQWCRRYCNGYNGVVHESSFPNTYNGTKHRASTIWLLNKNSTIVVVNLHQCSSDRKYVVPLQALMQPPSSASAHTIASTWPYHWCNHLALALVHWPLHPADGFLLLTQCTLSGM